jgi:hypothetical protein
MQKEEFRKLGFRCIEPTQVQIGGSVATVTAWGYKQSLEKKYPECTEHESRAWKFYSVVRKNQLDGEKISELELEEQIGIEAFNQLK